MTCENHKLKSIEITYNRCGKLDCKTCYTSTASKQAIKINEKTREFKRLAENNYVRVGRVIHLTVSPKKALITSKLRSYDMFLKFRKSAYKMLKLSGIHSGFIFTHVWSITCRDCGKDESECTCVGDNLYWEISPHFHIIGYGYLLNTTEFKALYKDWIVRNFGRRDDAYETALYLLTHCAIWRKPNGKLKPAYEPFGELHPKRFKTISSKVVSVPKKCPRCKSVMKQIVKGIKVTGDRPQIAGAVTLQYKALRLGINTAGLTREEIENRIAQCVYKNENFKLEVSEKDLKLGQEIRYLTTKRRYKIKSLASLRETVQKNKRKYKEDVKKFAEQKQKEGNGYG